MPALDSNFETKCWYEIPTESPAHIQSRNACMIYHCDEWRPRVSIFQTRPNKASSKLSYGKRFVIGTHQLARTLAGGRPRGSNHLFRKIKRLESWVGGTLSWCRHDPSLPCTLLLLHSPGRSPGRWLCKLSFTRVMHPAILITVRLHLQWVSITWASARPSLCTTSAWGKLNSSYIYLSKFTPFYFSYSSAATSLFTYLIRTQTCCIILT